MNGNIIRPILQITAHYGGKRWNNPPFLRGWVAGSAVGGAVGKDWRRKKMVNYMLRIGADLENITDLQPHGGCDDPTMPYLFKVSTIFFSFFLVLF